ncbi:MAG: radical SAM protein [Parcubacteria group bacterium]|jgi:MoaA/NifB/PqqE/SkfB family radical SAM enzyme
MANIGYIQITRECNQKCIICSNPPTDQFLEFAQAKKEIDGLKAKGCSGVIFTGGEPTLYAKLPELIKYASRAGLFPRIITNGQKIAKIAYLKELKKAGLKHLHLSVYSGEEGIQSRLSGNKNSLKNIKKALDNLKKIGGISVDVNTAISRYNAGHLSKTASWLIERYPFISHFVFNNLDPFMNRVSENPEVVPKLADFELELHKTLKMLEQNKKTFRVERVPLCYLPEFEHIATETRKIIKSESRMIFFLDRRGKFEQTGFREYKKFPPCQACSLKKICAGLYAKGGYYSEKELFPVFVDPQNIIDKISKG